MLPEVPFAELALLATAILVAGILTGIFAGLFGVGGGAVIVPVLFEAFRILGVPEEVRMQLCIGTSLGIIVPTTIRSYRTHRAAGMVLQRVLRAWTLPATAGVGVSHTFEEPGKKIATLLFGGWPGYIKSSDLAISRLASAI